MAEKCGTLYICATPIGNMADITLRVIETLKSADYVAAEDTRHTLRLLNHYGIKKPLISCHEHNEAARQGEIAALLKEGKNVALVSDAGMPGISDPGGRVVSECVKNGLPVTVCPGASALVTAVVLSGINSDRFVFEGFLPKKPKERKLRLAELKLERRTIVLYEAPHRLLKTLAELLEHFGEREIAVAREMTKLHEEVVRTTISGAIRVFEEKGARGEFVLVVAGAAEEPKAAKSAGELDAASVAKLVEGYIREGCREMDAIKKTAKDLGVPKREIYGEYKCKT